MSSFFNLTRNEQKGLIGILIIVLCIFGFKIYNHQELAIRFKEADLEIKAINSEKGADQIQVVQPFSNKKKNTSKKTVVLQDIFQFNPNLFEEGDWRKIGVPNDIAVRTYKYIKLRSGINRAEDLLSVYGFKESWLDQLKDSIVFNQSKVDVQTASQEEIEKINGLGPVLSKRIVKFREALGGYLHLGQVKEVYGIDSLKFVEIQSKIMISNTKVEKLDLLNNSFNELVKHPYLSKEEVFQVISIRSEKGRIEKSDLINIFGELGYQKTKGYFNE